VLTNARPKLILWWSFFGTYGQTGNDTYSIYPTGTEAAARWSGLSEAIQAPFPGTSRARPGTQTASLNAHLASSGHRAASRHRPRAHIALMKHHRRHHRRHRKLHHHKRHLRHV
jgi:hypothetical protein